MFQFRRFPSYSYGFTVWYIGVTLCGLLHSDICGSMLACSSPQLFAACHVLLRLPVPRHSPCALLSLTFCLFCAFLTNTAKTLISFSLFRDAERCSVRFYCFLLSSFCSLDVHKYAYRSKRTILCSKISQKMRFMILCIIISVHITILWICSLELSEFLR